MDYKVLKEKFFMGTTSREEEDALRRYLIGENLSPEAEADKEMMLAMLQPVEYDCSAAMEEVTAIIDNLAEQESIAAVEKSAQRSVTLRYLVSTFTVAAVLALLFIVVPYSNDTLGIQGGTENKQNVVSFEQPPKTDEVITIVLEEPGSVTVTEPESISEMPSERESETIVTLLAEETVTTPVDNAPDSVIICNGNAVADMLASITDENDTFSNPQDAAVHLDVLLAIFSQAVSGGVEEQKMHLKQFVVMNGTVE